jgi:hypothetical protein
MQSSAVPQAMKSPAKKKFRVSDPPKFSKLLNKKGKSR